MEILNLILVMVYFCCLFYGADGSCPRDKSRLVRRVVHNTIKPLFEVIEVKMLASCPFNEDLDKYYIHEIKKMGESYSRWYCGFCGKSFYLENYLDNHMNNRHPEHERKGTNTICLADYCDVFRCEVIGGDVEPQFWDTALCIEDDMKELQNICTNIMKSCVPSNIPRNVSIKLTDSLVERVCSSLTCQKYWESKYDNPSQLHILLNTFLTVMMISSMIIYYFLAYHHFYTESLYEAAYPQYEYRDPKYRNNSRRRGRHVYTDSSYDRFGYPQT